MINQQLLDYIKQQLQQNTSKEQIRSTLITNGWQPQDVDNAFSFISNPVNPPLPAQPPTQTISTLPSATAILGQSWSLYKQRLGTFLGIMIIPVLVIIMLFAILAVGGSLFVVLFLSKLASGGLGLILLLSILTFLFLIVIFLVQVWGQTALLYAIKDSQEGIGVVESYRRGWHKILPYWWIILLSMVITAGGFILLVVPGIIFAIWFSLAIFVLISEDKKGMSALLKSKEYVKGKWGGVLWRLFFISVTSFIISLVVAFIFGILKVPFGSQISNLIIVLFVTPLVVTYSFLIYSNLKAIKGEIVFAPTARKKATFIIIGIIGLLVIPAIGIFSSVILASLNTSRATGTNNAIKTNLGNMRAQAAIYYDSNAGSYGIAQNDSCVNTPGTLWNDPITQTIITAITNADVIPVCNSAATAWAMSATLKVPETGGSYWCVDSTGVSKGESTNLGSGVVACP